MVGMGVARGPGVLGDLGTVVNLRESTGSVPQGPVRLVCRPVEKGRVFFTLPWMCRLNP